MYESQHIARVLLAAVLYLSSLGIGAVGQAYFFVSFDFELGFVWLAIVYDCYELAFVVSVDFTTLSHVVNAGKNC